MSSASSDDAGTSPARLAYSLVAPAEGQPAATRWLLFLHGIFGSGANWRTFARRVVDAHPGWGAVLVDLRMHGASQALLPPHTVDACAADLAALEPVLPGPVTAVVGHSFGGKVALAYAASRAAVVAQAFVLDAMPGPRPGGRGSETTVGVLGELSRLRAREPFASREAFTAALTAAGYTPQIAQWLAMNLRRDPDGLRVKLDLGAIGALLDDYFARDLWAVIESPPGALRVHVVLGGRSPVFDAADRDRVARAAAASGGRVTLDVLPDAGHWVHVDDPEGLYQIIDRRLMA